MTRNRWRKRMVEDKNKREISNVRFDFGVLETNLMWSVVRELVFKCEWVLFLLKSDCKKIKLLKKEYIWFWKTLKKKYLPLAKKTRIEKKKKNRR